MEAETKAGAWVLNSRALRALIVREAPVLNPADPVVVAHSCTRCQHRAKIAKQVFGSTIVLRYVQTFAQAAGELGGRPRPPRAGTFDTATEL